MNKRDDNNTGKVTLDIELKDLLGMVSSSKEPPITNFPTQHAMDGEDLRKAWFKHVLISIEKLSDTVQELRAKELVDLRKELKSEFHNDINRIEIRITKNEDSLELYKKEVIKPVERKINTLMVKMGMWAALFGFISSGVMALIVYWARDYFFPKGGL